MVGVIGVLAVAVIGGGGVAWRRAAEGAEALAELRRRNAETRTELATVEKRWKLEVKRAGEVEGDNATLAAAVKTAQAASAAAVVGRPLAVSRGEMEERITRAVALARDGSDAEAALRELLWCYDAAPPQALGLTRVQFVIVAGALGRLGERHPAALAALRERLEKARRRVLGSADDMEPLAEVTAIRAALKDDGILIALYDAIPVGDERRAQVANAAFRDFAVAGRYADALLGQNFASMSGFFEVSVRNRPAAHAKAGAAAPKDSYAAATTVTNIEVLAGAGDLVHARELAARLLAVDGSESTRALLQTRLERAGQPGLLKEAVK